MTRLAFLDIEASGFGPGSYPVEVGWTFANGTGEAWLICPPDEWTAAGWDAAAEALHGLSHAWLEHEGWSAAYVADRAAAQLADVLLYTDAAVIDSQWLARLLEWASPPASLNVRPFTDLLRLVGADATAVQAAITAASQMAPRQHRALADSRHLWAIWCHLGGE
ncbi:hypothetical protein [Azospirillum canadense]|uniref:hypothetical protein n=1 Tax=Azospirillum canadense TaxID=403962 RepID=UPI002225B771|nr:hypothetical protein [Azospirillum canadense]MCW2239496.1 hypothetical protein [Azospirillum canadense]